MYPAYAQNLNLAIFIYPGNYTEQVYVQRRSAHLTFYGYTLDSSSYHANQVTISARKSQADGLSNDMSATLRAWASNFTMYNVNVENTYGQGSQAVALSAKGTAGYYGCAFTGFQDTVLSDSGNQTYARSLITGATDFIFGQVSPGETPRIPRNHVASTNDLVCRTPWLVTPWAVVLTR